MCSDQWGRFPDIIADQSGVVGRVGCSCFAGGGSVGLPVGRLFVRSGTSGGLRTLAPAVGGQLFGTGPGVGASTSANREIPVPRWRLAREGPFLEECSPAGAVVQR